MSDPTVIAIVALGLGAVWGIALTIWLLALAAPQRSYQPTLAQRFLHWVWVAKSSYL
jgi:hypothetical protein